MLGAAGWRGRAVQPPVDFPRLGLMSIGNPQNYDETTYQQQVARFDMAILGMYNGWHQGGKTPAQAVSQIKSLNPRMLMGNYTLMTELTSSTSNPSTLYAHNKLSSEVGPGGVGNWWAYDAAGIHTDWSGGSFSSWDTNPTLLTTPDANGDRWPQWQAKSDFSLMLSNANFDIWFTDNCFWKPRSDADWNRNGVNDSQDNIAVRNWWRDGQRAYYDTAATAAPGLLLMANVDSDLDGSVFPTTADSFTQFKDVLGAAYMEHTMGMSWSVETWGGWNLVMDWYRQLKTNLLPPQTLLFDIYLASTTDYQAFRYGMATCLMDDGYFSASTNYNQVVWFDEYDLAGTASTKWLGQPIDSPPTSAWQSGVYRRNFTGGAALVNPKGNGSQTVTIGAGYHRIAGGQAPTVNTGAAATTVTLQDRDGILLVKD